MHRCRLAEALNIIRRNKDGDFIAIPINHNKCQPIKTGRIKLLPRNIDRKLVLSCAGDIDVTHNITRP